LNHRFFITGTDTDCGKTLVTQGFMHLCKLQGMTTAGMKPVASGGIAQTDGVLRNSDALMIQSCCSTSTPYQLINPYCFEPPVAPHLAADMSSTRIDLPIIQAAYSELAQQNEHMVVEGVGGWRVPLNDELDVAGLCQALRLPVVLVVGMKLGCINHALLTARSILSDDVPLLGWVANCVDPEMHLLEQNISTLQHLIPAPLLGTIPFLADISPTVIAKSLSLPGEE
jgi:dethiobiotin synthetase